MTSLAEGTKLVTIATQTTDTSDPLSSADLSAIAAAESLYNDDLSAFYHGSWPLTDSGGPICNNNNNNNNKSSATA